MALRAVPNHPKFAHLKSIIKLPKGALLGWLESVWHFTAQFTPQGNIGKYTDREIEAWVEWDGEPGRLLEALTESKWLDPDPEHRLLVHDWAEHADKATKQSLKNKNLGFCVPTMRPVGAHSAHTSPESSNVCAPPVPGAGAVPEPVPVPEPGADAEPPQAAEAPPVSQTAPSPGANGEFMAAVGLMQDIELAATAGDIRVMAQVIAFEARHRDGVEGAVAFLKGTAIKARARGEPVTVFWFKDRKYEHTEANGNGANQSNRGAAVGRVERSVARWGRAAAELRGTRTADDVV